MSKRIDQTLEVLEEVWMRHPVLAAVRSEAVKRVARRHGTQPQSLHTKMTRELMPAIRGAKQLDAFIWRWLGGDSKPLRDAMLAAAGGSQDGEVIKAFFARPWL